MSSGRAIILLLANLDWSWSLSRVGSTTTCMNVIGRIINITSANGSWCLPGLSVYCASKHGVEGFSNALRADMIPWNVKVVLINPGNF